MGGTISRLQRDSNAGVDAGSVERLHHGDERVQPHLLGDAAVQRSAVNSIDNSRLAGGLKGRKRKRETSSRNAKRLRYEEDDAGDLIVSSYDSDAEFDRILHTPNKRKLRTTSRYIFETLYLEGRESDVTVTALNREWKLHKLYLCQSRYFQSMFSGSWRESTMTRIDIQVVDTNVTLDALHVALGSLYQDEITVEPADVIPILAAATLIQLEGLMDQCTAIMEETINVKTVGKYLETSITYGVATVEKSCMNWFKVNLLSYMPEHPDRLRDITPELMATLVKSPQLFVIQTEFSVYVLLRLWLYLIFHKAWDGTPQEAVLKSHSFFQDRVKSTKKFFLETEEGLPYVQVFRNLRLNHLVNHHMDMEMLLTDRIIPRKWMYPVYQNQWRLLLRTDQGIDNGPQDLVAEEFDRVCFRCGRSLNISDQQHMWRWTGFGMGLDLIVAYANGSISFKRSLGTASSSRRGGGEHEALLSNHKERHVYYRVTVVSLNDQKQIIYRATSDIRSVSLAKNASHKLLEIDVKKASFPLALSFNFAVNTPLSKSEDDDEESHLDENVNEPVPTVSGHQNLNEDANESTENNVMAAPG